MNKKQYILSIFFFWICFQQITSQENSINQKDITFSVKVSIVDKVTNFHIVNAEVYVNGTKYFHPTINNKYVVKAKIGDQLRVSHPDFETVYYTIKSSEDIQILVDGLGDNTHFKSSFKRKNENLYHNYLDSAKYYLKKDIDKSLSFIEKSLKNKQSRKRNAAAYKTLADIYMYWKQYDLAINNYKLSAQISNEIATKIQLAKAQFLYQDFTASKKTYKELLQKN